MNFAVFFQKNGGKRWVGIFQMLYMKLGLRNNRARIKYLRDAGAKIGEGTIIDGIGVLGSEPWLVEIGNNTRISGTATQIFTHDGGVGRLYHMGVAPEIYDYMGKVKIGNNCFIGHNCIIMKHVTIGENCVIGAGSVVTKSIPANSVACGVPAKVICSVEDYYNKNKEHFEKVVWGKYRKRMFHEQNMERYEALRIQHECKD